MKLLVLLVVITWTEILFCLVATNATGSGDTGDVMGGPFVILTETSFSLTEGGNSVQVCVTVSPEMTVGEFTVGLNEIPPPAGTMLDSNERFIPAGMIAFVARLLLLFRSCRSYNYFI